MVEYCPKCGQKLDEEVPECPKCGAVLEANVRLLKAKKIAKICFAVIVLVLIIIIFANCV